MALPIVAIVGRPNVGKSTLINKVASSREAITHSIPGVTRDRKYVDIDWDYKDFTLIDTGGFEFEKNKKLSSMIAEQATLAIEEATSVVFVVDAKEGLHPYDQEIATLLRKTQKNIFVAVNKIDTEAKENDAAVFYALGFSDMFMISSAHGAGITELFDKVAESLPKEKVQKDERLSVAIVGRPNAGKSSLLNKVLGQERVIVSEVAGTTRDAIDSVVSFDGSDWLFIDTAGIKRKKGTDIEYYSLVRTLEVLDRADVALIMIDATESVTEQDQKIVDYAVSRGCAMIILLNKWDLVDEELSLKLRRAVDRKLRFLSYVPIIDVSVKSGKGLKNIFKQILQIEKEYSKTLKTSELNNFVRKLDLGVFPTRHKIRLSYASQIDTKPPRLIFFIKPIKAATAPFKRFLENQLRSNFGFFGTPIKIIFKEKLRD